MTATLSGIELAGTNVECNCSRLYPHAHEHMACCGAPENRQAPDGDLPDGVFACKGGCGNFVHASCAAHRCCPACVPNLPAAIDMANTVGIPLSRAFGYLATADRRATGVPE